MVLIHLLGAAVIKCFQPYAAALWLSRLVYLHDAYSFLSPYFFPSLRYAPRPWLLFLSVLILLSIATNRTNVLPP